MSELCDRYQISRPTGYKWIDRIEAEGLKAVEGSGACAPFFPDLEGRVRAGSGTESQRFPRQFRSCSLRERRLSKGGRIGHFGNAIAARHGIASGFNITPRLGRCAGTRLECPIPEMSSLGNAMTLRPLGRRGYICSTRSEVGLLYGSTTSLGFFESMLYEKNFPHK
jgi:hypothetical protein